MVIDIELNNNTGLEYTRNANYITNRIIADNLIGEDYSKKTQGILVNLNWFKLKSDKENIDNVVEVIWEYPLLKKNKPNYFVKFINVNLFKIQQICYTDIKEEELVWKLFTLNKKEELKELVNHEKMLNNYQKKLERLSKSKEYCRMVWDERIEEKLRNHDAYENGKDEGIEQKQTEMIINMYNDGLELNQISKYANISIEEIKKIINTYVK